MPPYADSADRRASCARYYREHKEQIRARKDFVHKENHGKRIARDRKKYLANREKIIRENNARDAAKRAIDPEQVRTYHTNYRRANHERLRQQARPRDRAKAKLNATPKGAIDNRMGTAIYAAVRASKGGRSWEQLVGYTLPDLMRHIEAHFRPGMNWDRFLKSQIHIDHIIPKSKFTYSSPEDPEFRRCWALENLMPKWRRPNLRKGAKLERPSQIPLGL